MVALSLAGLSLAGSAAASPPIAISGQVTSLVGYPAGTAQVEADFDAGGVWTHSTPVDVGANGVFSVDVANGAGPYDLYFTVPSDSVPFLSTYSNGTQQEPDASSPTGPGIIDASAGSVSALTFSLVAAGHITGTVTSGGVALSGENIAAFSIATGNEYDALAPTDVNGAYSIKVVADDPMEVGEGSDPAYYPQTYNGHDIDPTNFDPVTVGAGLTKTGIDFNLDPVAGTILIGLDVENNPAPKQPADNVTVKLTVLDEQGHIVQTSSTIVRGGFGILVGSNAGDYQIEITNSAGKRYAMDAVSAYGTQDPFVVAGSCVADLGVVDQSDLDASESGIIEFDLNPDLGLCNAAPTTPTVPKHHHPSILTGAVAPVATATPTPTPTAMATPSPSPATTFTATPTPSATPVAPAPSGFPWWGWLLVMLAIILILVVLGFVLLRRR